MDETLDSLETLVRQWWLLALRGALAITFGILALVWPGTTLLSLALLFAAFALIIGAVWTWAAVRHRRSDRQWWVLLLFGLAGLLTGVLASLEPLLTMLALVILVGANALVTGVMDIVIAVHMRKTIRGEWLLALTGAASCLFGLLVLLFPATAGVLALAVLIGTYAIFSGVLLLVLAWRVRNWWRMHGGRSSPAAGTA